MHQRFWNQCFDKGRLKSFVLWFFANYGEHKTVELLENLKNIGFEYATKAGISLGIDDLKIPPKKTILMAEAEAQTRATINQYKRGEITGVERFQRLIDTWHRTSESLKQEVIDHFQTTDILNPVYMMAFSGARGNVSQVRQLVGMRGLMADPQGQILDFPIRSNFREGLTLTEYIISCYGARKGIVDTALRTANAGYLTRRLVDVAQHVIVAHFDCGTKRGIVLTDMKEGNKTIYSLTNRLVGRVLAQDVEKIGYRNQEISTELAVNLAKHQQRIFVRSPLTCESNQLVCQLCYGWSLAQGNLVSIGEAVGIIAAQSIGEPGTQLTMRTFHTGGVFAGDVTDQIKAPYDGIATYPRSIPGTLIRTSEGKIAFLTKNDGMIKVENKKSGDFKEESSNECKLYKIPPFTVLFVKNGENVYSKQVIAQISNITKNQFKRNEAERCVNAEIDGEVFFPTLKTKELLFVLKKGEDLATTKIATKSIRTPDEWNAETQEEISTKSIRTPDEQLRSKKNIKTKIEEYTSPTNLSKLKLEKEITDALKKGPEGPRKIDNWTSGSVLSGKIYQTPIPANFFPKEGDYVGKPLGQKNNLGILNGIKWLSEKHLCFSSSFYFFKKPLLSIPIQNFRYKKTGYFFRSLNKDSFFIRTSFFSPSSKEKKIENEKNQKLDSIDFFLEWFPYNLQIRSSGLSLHGNPLRSPLLLSSIASNAAGLRTDVRAAVQSTAGFKNRPLLLSSIAIIIQHCLQCCSNAAGLRTDVSLSNTKTTFYSNSVADSAVEKTTKSIRTPDECTTKQESVYSNTALPLTEILNIFDFESKILWIPENSYQISNQVGQNTVIFGRSIQIKDNKIIYINRQGRKKTMTCIYNSYEKKEFIKTNKTQKNNNAALQAMLDTKSIRTPDECNNRFKTCSIVTPLTKNKKNKPAALQTMFDKKNVKLRNGLFLYPTGSTDTTEYSNTAFDNGTAGVQATGHLTTNIASFSTQKKKAKNLCCRLNVESILHPSVLLDINMQQVLTKVLQLSNGQLDINKMDDLKILLCKAQQLVISSIACNTARKKTTAKAGYEYDKFKKRGNGYLKKLWTSFWYENTPASALQAMLDTKSIRTPDECNNRVKFFHSPISHRHGLVDSKIELKNWDRLQLLLKQQKMKFIPNNFDSFPELHLNSFSLLLSSIAIIIQHCLQCCSNAAEPGTSPFTKKKNSILSNNVTTQIKQKKSWYYVKIADKYLEGAYIRSESEWTSYTHNTKDDDFHKKILFPGQQFIDDITFDKNIVYIESAPLYFDAVDSIQNQSSLLNLAQKIAVSKEDLFFSQKISKNSTMIQKDVEKPDECTKSIIFTSNLDSYRTPNVSALQAMLDTKSIRTPDECNNIDSETNNMSDSQMPVPKDNKKTIPFSPILKKWYKNKKSRFEPTFVRAAVQSTAARRINESDDNLTSFEKIYTLDPIIEYTPDNSYKKFLKLFIPKEYQQPFESFVKYQKYHYPQKRKINKFFETTSLRTSVRAAGYPAVPCTAAAAVHSTAEYEYDKFEYAEGFDKSPAALQAMLDNKNGRFLNPAVRSTAARSIRNQSENRADSAAASFTKEADANFSPLFRHIRFRAFPDKLSKKEKAKHLNIFLLKQATFVESPSANKFESSARYPAVPCTSVRAAADAAGNKFRPYGLRSPFQKVVSRVQKTDIIFKPASSMLDSAQIFEGNMVPSVAQLEKQENIDLQLDILMSNAQPGVRMDFVQSEIPDHITNNLEKNFQRKISSLFARLKLNKAALQAMLQHSVIHMFLNAASNQAVPLDHAALHSTRVSGFDNNSVFQTFKIYNFIYCLKPLNFQPQFIGYLSNDSVANFEVPTISFKRIFQPDLIHFGKRLIHIGKQPRQNMSKKLQTRVFSRFWFDFSMFQKTDYKLKEYPVEKFENNAGMHRSSASNASLKHKEGNFLSTSGIKTSTFFNIKKYPDQHLIFTNESALARTAFLSPFEGEILKITKSQCLILTKTDQISFYNKTTIENTTAMQLSNGPLDLTTESIRTPDECTILTQSKNKKIYSRAVDLIVGPPKKQYKVAAEAALAGAAGYKYSEKGIQKNSPNAAGDFVLGDSLVYGDMLKSLNTSTPTQQVENVGLKIPGQIIHLNKNKITLRRTQPLFLSPNTILHSFNGDFVEKNTPLMTLPFQVLTTGDIVQGIPKIEQLFEARTTKNGRFFKESIPNLLIALYQRYKTRLPLDQAVRQSFYKIQQIIIDGVQRVYRSQGVTIADKHIEIIVKQMTSKVLVVKSGQTGFLPGEILDLEFVEKINVLLIKKIRYEPIILGITKASLEVDSFLSAASFQQTTKVLSRAAISKKRDFLKGLKENVIVGNLIPAGTGYIKEKF